MTLGTVAAGCGSSFESSWDIKIRNDTARAVIVRDCTTGDCHRFRYTKRLAPHKFAPALDYGDGTSWWLVRDVEGRMIGCLTLGVGQRVEDYVLRVSTIRKCPFAAQGA